MQPDEEKQTNLFSEIDHKSSAANTPLPLTAIEDKPLLLNFDGGQISSDAGLLILRETEQQIGIIKSFSETIYDPRIKQKTKKIMV